MNESYAEAAVKKKKTIGSYLIQAGMIFLIVFLLFFGTPIFGLFAVPLASVVMVLCIIIFPRLNIEYEYIFCDGQLDFDKIMGGAKRKTALRIDFEKVEIMALATSHALDPYKNNPQVKVKNFTSLEPNRRVYAVIVREEGLLQILFEPNEKMLEAIKQKTPRKLVEV